MPVTLNYPGVYLQEIGSGVRTIVGVGTSVAAFAGAAPRGPINLPVRLYGFADYERRFGGLDADSEMSYGVRQFFQNGGTEAWAVRLVRSAESAQLVLQSDAGKDVLRLTALDAGLAGNDIQVRVGRSGSGSGFDLALMRLGDGASESYANLSMNARDVRYVRDQVNSTSRLVKVERKVSDAELAALAPAQARSGPLGDVATLVDATHNEFRVSVNGLPELRVQLAPGTDTSGASPATRLTKLCAAIEAKVVAQAAGRPEYAQFKCAPDAGVIVMTSGLGGEASSVRLLAGQGNNALGRLQLGAASGGTEQDAVASIRPKPGPEAASLTSGNFVAADLDALPSATANAFDIALDGGARQTVTLDNAAAAGANLPAKLANVATRIEAAVRGLRPDSAAHANFSCSVVGNALVLVTGTRGSAGSVSVSAAAENDIAAGLHLLAGTARPAPDLMLALGSEVPYGSADVYPAFIGDRAKRQGIYALEAVDLFNLLVLPGITDAATLSDAEAYCRERRAFLIIDAPLRAGGGDDLVPDPAEMLATVRGTALPKSDHAAVYYPWLHIADPLRNGRLRLTPPSGSIAGLYARTDADRGVWKAPAGTEARIVGAQALAYPLTDRDNGGLNPRGVNCIRSFPVHGVVSWGARTLAGDDDAPSEYKYVPIRRLALFIEESLLRGTQWTVFEPNDEPLWAQIRLNLGAFMNGLFRQGAFQGRTPRDAYLVKCDSQTTTQDDINKGIVNILVGFAPLKPAEFVLIRIQQLAGQIQT